MPEPAAVPRKPRRAVRLSGRALVALIPRAYAGALIIVIVWLTFLAVRYLVRSLITPAVTPPQIAALPTRLRAETLRERRGEFAGLAAAAHARAPLSHYHRIDGWIQPDRFNDCTRSGCHLPLPHARHKEVRAFLNMHATSIHCGVCHLQSADTPLALTWYDLGGGQPRQPPAALRAYDFVMSVEGRQRLAQPTEQDQAELAELLRAAAREADGERALAALAEHVSAVRVTSAAFGQLIEAARTTLPQHFRGEYGAKLALRDARTGGPVLAHPDTRAAVDEYLQRGASPAGTERGPALTGAERAALLARVHPLKRPQPRHCSDCHRPAGGLIDFAQAGYPPARRETLVGGPVFQMIEHISAGQPMHLPGFVVPETRP